MFLRTYAKSLLAVTATIITGLVAALSDNHITANEWLNVAILGVTAAAVFAAPNVPGARYTKGILAVLGAALTFLASAIIGGVTAAEWLQVAVVSLTALGVFAAPYAPLTKLDGTIDGLDPQDALVAHYAAATDVPHDPGPDVRP